MISFSISCAQVLRLSRSVPWPLRNLTLLYFALAVIDDVAAGNRFEHLLDAQLQRPLRFEVQLVANLCKAHAVVAAIGVFFVDDQFRTRHVLMNDFADLPNRVVLLVAADVENFIPNQFPSALPTPWQSPAPHRRRARTAAIGFRR